MRWTAGRLAVALLCGASAGWSSPTAPDEVVFTGRFVTLDPAQPEAEAMLVRDGRIAALGSRTAVEARAAATIRRVALPGVALPGFAEAHGHALALGEQLDRLDLRGLPKAQILEGVRAAAARLPAGEWIRGQGWDQGDWEPPVYPTAAELDAAAPQHPVFLERIDLHAGWLNSRALALAGISHKTPDPEGGRLERDSAGRPTGILVDAALDPVAAVLPATTPERLAARLEAALRQYARWGVTSLHDAGVGLDELAAYRRFAEQGRLPIRVYAMAHGTAPTLEPVLAGGPLVGLGRDRLTLRAFKVMLDGALGSRGAQLAAPYADAPGETGLSLMDDAAFAKLLRRATERGFQVAVHAIGDRANRRALDAIEALGPSAATARHRIEHVSMVAPADVPRFAALGVIASMQPNFVGEYGRWAIERVGPERIGWVYPTRRIVETGAVVAAGTDYPAADTGDPIVTLYCLVTRRGARGEPAAGFLPDERVSVETALRLMTRDAAWAAFQESDLGALTIGRHADLTVLSADPRTVAPEDLRELVVVATVVGGQLVHAATPLAPVEP